MQNNDLFTLPVIIHDRVKPVSNSEYGGGLELATYRALDQVICM